MITQLDKAAHTSIQPRFAAFDLARGLAIFFMILVHTLDFYGQKYIHDTIFGTIVDFVGRSPAAPVFMFIMGIFIVSSRRVNIAQGLKRAAWLIALGYILNLTRGSIPMWLSLEMGLVTPEQLGKYTPLTEFMVGDILQFAGLAYAICVLLRGFVPHPKYWIGVALVTVASSPLVWGISSNFLPLDLVLQLLWGSKTQGMMFPLFPWLTFPVLGMVFGYWLKHSENKQKFHKNVLWLGLILLAIGTGVTLTNIEFHMGDYARSGPGAMIWIVGFVLVWLCICKYIVEKTPTNPCFDLLYFWSNNVTAIYVIQWLIIGWGLMAIGVQTLSLSNTIIAMFVVLLLSDLILRIWLWLRNKRSVKQSVITAQNTTA